MLSRSRAPRPTDLQMLDAELEIVQEYSQTIRLDMNAGWALFNGSTNKSLHYQHKRTTTTDFIFFLISLNLYQRGL